MKTSYFAKYKGKNGVSIAYSSPRGFTGHIYEELAPDYHLLNAYKNNVIDEEEYTEYYYKNILSSLDPNEVYTDLKDKVLLCWEGKDKFCHRHLVAEWLTLNLGVVVEELE